MTNMPRSKRGDVSSLSVKLSLALKALESKGEKVIRMHIGAPSTGAPQAAIEAAIEAEQNNILGYTSGAGLPELRERIATHYLDEYSVTVDPKRILIAVGASMAFTVAALACLDVGDKFCLPYPVYPAYDATLKLLGIETVGYSTRPENKFQLSPEDVDSFDDDIKAVIVASPSNPVGSIMDEDEFKSSH